MELFIALLAGHVIGDFVLQSKAMVARKTKLRWLLIHITIITIASWVIIGTTNNIIIACVFLSHLIIDAIKVHCFKEDNIRSFLLDQMMHLVSLIFIAGFNYYNFSQVLWLRIGVGIGASDYTKFLILIIGFILTTKFGEIIIRYLTAKFKPTEDGKIEGITNAGSIIGNLERTIAYSFILMGQPTAIAFLMTAKSILRFGDITTDTERKQTEYIIIGTFMSFTWAILVAAATNYALTTVK